MGNYKDLKVSKLRKILSEKVKNGEIPCPSNAPSKIIRMMGKKALIEVLTEGEWMGNPPAEVPAEEDVVFGEDANSGSTEGAEESGSDDNGDTEGDGMPSFGEGEGGSDRQYVTNQGMVNVEDVAIDLGLPEFANSLAGTLKQMMSADIKLANKIKDLSLDGGGGSVTITVSDKKPKKIDAHCHPQFKKILNYSKWHQNVFLVGEAGTGKTTVAQQVAEALELPFAHLSCSAGMSEAHILGRMLFDGTYVESDFVRIYENGGVFLLDEFDAMDGNTAVVINSALANGVMSVPNRKDNPIAKRHANTVIIASANTWGTGYGSNQYAGRNRLDGATLDRFACSKVSFRYDKGLERKLAGEHKDLANTLWLLRKRIKSQNINRIISTRLFIGGNTALTNGETIKDFLDTITVDWTTEERNKVDVKNIHSDANGGGVVDETTKEVA